MKIRSLFTGAFLIAGLCAFTWSAKAVSFFDDFNSYVGASTYASGPDVTAGWKHYPGINVGLNNTWSFPVISGANQGYKMTSDPGTSTNPGRVASWYNAAGFTAITDFVVSADLVNWSTTAQQEMGLIARSTTQAFNFPSLYTLVLHQDNAGPGANTRLLIRYTDSAGIYTISPNNQGRFDAVGSSPAPDPSGDYRLVFWGVGTSLYGQIIDNSTGLTLKFNDGSGGLTDIVSATSALYTSGRTGLLGVIDDAQGVDPTFDNFLVTTEVPEPASAALAGLGIASLLIFRRRR